MKLILGGIFLLLVLTANGQVPAAGGSLISPRDPDSVQKGIDSAIAAGLKKIVIPPGVYRLTGERAPDKKRSWHLKFKDLKDFEIDATGATFIFTDPVNFGILFSNCHNVTFRGALLQWDPLPFSQGTITALDPKGMYLDLRVNAGYPDQLEDRVLFPTFWSALFSEDGKELKAAVRANTPPKIKLLEKGLYRIQLYDTIPTIKVPIKPGMHLAWRGPVKDDIRPMNCGAMKFIDITIAGAAGMAFHEMGGTGGNLYQRCRVTYPPLPKGATLDSLQASSADGLHSHDMEKGPIVEDCLFEGIGDDCIAIHGTYAMATEVAEQKMILWVFHETRDKLYCRPDETLRFYNDQGIPIGEALVDQVKALPEYKPSFKPNIVYRSFQEVAKDNFVEVTFKGKIPAVAQGNMVNNSNRSGNGYIVRDSIMRNSFSRGVIPKGSDGLIEGNTIENMFRAAVELMAEMEVWSEPDYARNIVIRNNVFRKVSQNRGDGYLRHPGALTIFNYQATTEDLDLSKRQGHYVPAPGGHRNILIENNRFEEINGPNVIITSAQGVTLRNNKFIHPMEQDKDLGSKKGIDTNALIWLSECADIKLEGNEIIAPGPFLKTNVKATASASGTGFDSGVQPSSPTQP